MIRIKEYNEYIDWTITEKLTPGLSLQHIWRGSWVNDYAQARRMFSSCGYVVSPQTWMNYINNTGYHARGAYRNRLYPVVVYLSQHGPKWNTIRAVGLNKNRCDGNDAMWYTGHLLALAQMVLHVRHELPELPTRLILPTNTLPVLRELPIECGMYEIDRNSKQSVWAIRRLYDRDSYRNHPQGDPGIQSVPEDGRLFNDGGRLTAVGDGSHIGPSIQVQSDEGDDPTMDLLEDPEVLPECDTEVVDEEPPQVGEQETDTPETYGSR
jgi:hypothetical protein